MRKYLAPLIGAAVFGTAMVAPTVAQGPAPETVLTVQSKVSNNKAGTKKKPRGVRLTVHTEWKTPDGFEPPIIQRAKAYFPKGSLWQGHKYPKCTEKKLNSFKGLAACPKGSIFGKGRGVAFADDVKTFPKVTGVVNGGKNKIWFYTVMTNPARVRAPVPGVIRKTSGKYAYELTLTVPESLQVVAGVPIALQSFDVYGGKTKAAPDIMATTSCPRNKQWPFKVTTFHSNGTDSTFEDSIRCR